MKIQRSIVSLALTLSFLSIFGEAQRTPVTPAAASAQTAIPALVPYSGNAFASDGKPLTGETGMTFLIYKEESGGEPLWTESQIASVDSTGHYKVQLGAANPNGLPSDLFSNGEARWLEIQVAGEKPQPRTLLASVPYALKAADAATLGGLPASAFALAGTTNAAYPAITGAAAISPEALTTVSTAGGASGYMPVFNGASSIVDSVVIANSTGIGILDTPAAGEALDVNGKSIFRNSPTINRNGNASVSAGVNSFPLVFEAETYNSSTKAYTYPEFSLQAEAAGNDSSTPTAALHFLFNSNLGYGAETGLYFNANGTVHFASAQTFPGTGAGTITGVTAGTGLTGGGTSGNVTLKVNTALLPTLAGNNTYTGSNVFVPSIYADLDVNIDNTNVNNGNISPGLRFGSASGEGIASKRTSGENQYGLDFYTDSAAAMQISQAGNIGIGEIPNPNTRLSVAAPGIAGLFHSNDFYSALYAQNDYVGVGFVFTAQGLSAECNMDTSGNLACDGTISGSAKDFKIDHPLDPANKYLVHSSVESSEMVNLYSGNVTTDDLGTATIKLPEWFEAENGDFRYQLTTIGRDAHAWISQEVANGEFKIATNATNVKVSWQITAVRQDKYAQAHPLVVEQEKPATERGLYRNPELFGQPREKHITSGHAPARAALHDELPGPAKEKQSE